MTVRTTNGTLVAQGLSPSDAEQMVKLMNQRAEKLNIETRYEAS